LAGVGVPAWCFEVATGLCDTQQKQENKHSSEVKAFFVSHFYAIWGGGNLI